MGPDLRDHVEVHTGDVSEITGTSVWEHTAAGWHERRTSGPGLGHRVWVRVPRREEFADVAAGLGIDRDVVAAVGGRGPAGDRPHVEHLEGGLYLVAPTLSYRQSTADVLSGQVACLVLDGVVLTAETGQAAVLDGLATRLAAPQAAVDRWSDGVLSALLSTLVAAASDVEVALAEAVENLEQSIFDSQRTTPVEQIYALKREIAEARRGLMPLGAELVELFFDPEDHAAADTWVRRLTAAVDRLDRRLDAQDELLADMLSAHLALVSVRQNDDVRRISAWAAIAAVPTLIASVYGMNFDHMPELAQPWAYPGVIGVMLAVSVVLHRLFTRSGWL